VPAANKKATRSRVAFLTPFYSYSFLVAFLLGFLTWALWPQRAAPFSHHDLGGECLLRGHRIHKSPSREFLAAAQPTARPAFRIDTHHHKCGVWHFNDYLSTEGLTISVPESSDDFVGLTFSAGLHLNEPSKFIPKHC
jgi:hypothetical protein